MTLPIEPVPVPLRPDEDGVYRVGNTRILLDTVIGEFENGADPESIVHGYSTLQLADVYAVLAYYLRHQNEVNAYLDQRRAQAAAFRQEIEANQPNRSGLRAKLLARRAEQEQEQRQEPEHASSRR